MLGVASGCATARSERAPEPEWVARGGASLAHPASRFVTGFARTRGGEEAIERARQQAAADLARQIQVEIESRFLDSVQERDGEIATSASEQTIQATSAIQLEGLRFEIHRRQQDVWALAVLERAPASAARRRERDRVRSEVQSCLEIARGAEDEGRITDALAAYHRCRTALERAFEHEAIARALEGGGRAGGSGPGSGPESSPGSGDPGASGGPAQETLSRLARRIEGRLRALPHEDARTMRAAAHALASQLAEAGVGRGRAIAVPPFRYHDRDVSSPFGREIALGLEAAIAGALRAEPEASTTSAVVIRGSYREEADRLHLRALAREARSGGLLASAELVLERSGLPEGLATRPPNLERFLRDSERLAGGEVVSGDLRIEVRTDRGSHGLVYEEGEALGLFVRVSQPAWVRLVYVLVNGDHVPIEQAWYLDGSKVNRFVEYREKFEIVPPFGVEMIHAMAFTEEPPRLVTRPTRIEGQAYHVVAEGAEQVVRHRGIARRRRQQLAEQTLQMTTLRRREP